jgi:nucleoside-diphosphate-sugar epimerase
VQQAMANPIEALNNNTFELFEFAKRLRSEQLFIYASSGSVYSNLHDHGEPHFSSESDQLRDPTNVYDASKMIFDNLVKFLDMRSVGLRMGTVSGFSPIMRNDLVFNAMNLSARSEAKVFLRNADSFRTLLFLEDLLGLIQSLVKSTSPIPKIINVGSSTLTIGSLAQSVARNWGVPVVSLEDSGGYNFKLDLALMQNYFSPIRTNIQDEVDNFRKMMNLE